jgi:hypothetical protein
MTDVNKAELRRLAEAATPGKWLTDGDEVGIVGGNVIGAYVAQKDGGRIGQAFVNCLVPTAEKCRANAAFIAAANPAAVLSLLDECESGEQWRNLALQFDMHRMQAMALIRMVASGAASSSQCYEFAARAPIPGHEITERLAKAEAERDAALAELAELREELSGVKNVSTETAKAMKRLVVCARTSGGTAGPDAGLMEACEQAEKMLSLGGIGRAYMEGADAAMAQEANHG